MDLLARTHHHAGRKNSRPSSKRSCRITAQSHREVQHMTHELIQLLAFIILGLAGQVAHYLKKRYWDNTTTLSLLQFIRNDPLSTKQAIASTILATATLSLAQDPSVGYHLSDILAPLTAGYTLDSWLNKTVYDPNLEDRGK